MKKNKTFSERLSIETRPYIKEVEALMKLPKNSEKRMIFEKRMQGSFLGERYPDDHLSLVPITPHKTHIKKIVNKFSEIQESLKRMRLGQVFLSKIRKNKKVSKLNYLQYHYENYLNEMFIYRERINSLLDYIIKICQKAKKTKEKEKVQELRKRFNKALENIINVRGSHVHIKRYSSNKLEQLYTLDSVSENFEFIRYYRDSELKNLKSIFLKEMKENIETLENFIEKDISKEIGDIIFIELFPKGK